MVLWYTYDCLDLYDGYLGAIDGFCYADDVCGNWTVPDLILLHGFFCCLAGHRFMQCDQIMRW